MLRQWDHHLHAGAATTNTSLAAADCRSSTSTCTRQQAAAAWAWFEHGGSSCITPNKSEGLVTAKRRAKHNVSAGPSRFKTEVLISSRKIPRQSSADYDSITEAGDAGWRHSFHNDDLMDRTSYMFSRLSSSCRSAPGLPCFNLDDGTVDDQDEAENEEGGNTLCQDEASSLLDKFEVEAVCRQLHDHLISSGRSPSCSPSSSSTCSTELQDDHEPQKAHHDYPHAHLKPPRYFKSSNGAAAHKPLADNEHHHNINDVVHRLLHLRIKMLSVRSSSPSPSHAPLICSSIATANSIVDHHRRRSRKQLRTEAPINQTAKRVQVALHDRGIRQNIGRVSNYNGELKLNYDQDSSTADEGSATTDELHEREDFMSKHHCKSEQKAPRRDHELIEGTSTPSSLHQSDSKYSKALQRLVSHLPHISSLLGHHMHGGQSWREDGVQACTKRHCHFHEHHHIHHFHHHYHDLQQTNQASQDAVRLVQDREGDRAHVLEAQKLYKLQKVELMLRPAHGGGAQRAAAAAADYKTKNCLCPAPYYTAAAGNDHGAALQVPGPDLLIYTTSSQHTV